MSETSWAARSRFTYKINFVDHECQNVKKEKLEKGKEK